MNDLAALIDQLSLSYEVGSSMCVCVTHIEDPENFYVRPLACTILLRNLEKPINENMMEASELDIGSHVIFNSQTLRHYARGEIQCITDGDGDEAKYTMFAIDYGFVEKNVAVKRIKRPRTDVPGAMFPLAINCELADCKPPGGQWTEHSKDDMTHFINDELCRMTVRGVVGEKLVVDLRNSVDDIALVMALTECCHLGCGRNSISRLVKNPPQVKAFVSYKNLRVDEVLHVRVLSGKSLEEFYVADVRDYAEYVKDSTVFKNDVRASRLLTVPELKVGTPVAALISMEHERAVIKKITVPETKAIVQLLDWGITKELDIMLMKQLSEYYCSMPAKAIFCTAEKSQIWDHGMGKFLYPGYEFKITIIKVGNDFEVPNVVKLTRASTM